jgi:oligoribonuclease (3'-5' exoribonuclease)
MTGLDPDTDAIIEIYCLVTDGQLKILDEAGWGTVVHQTEERMARMDEWCTRVRRFPRACLNRGLRCEALETLPHEEDD